MKINIYLIFIKKDYIVSKNLFKIYQFVIEFFIYIIFDIKFNIIFFILIISQYIFNFINIYYSIIKRIFQYLYFIIN